jgi:hypothetical protein
MFKHQELLRSFGQMTLATGLTLALVPAFASDLPAGTYSVDGAKPALTFDAKGRFHVEQDGKMVVEGKYSTQGDQIQFTDNSGPWACTKDGEKTGTYQWKYDNKVLTLSKVADACTDRAGSLAAVKWKLHQKS